jgi:uncharacterized SAM-dependent methyltransferase
MPDAFSDAYFDTTGLRFILNGLQHVNKILKGPVFKLEDWEVIGEYVYDSEGGRHQALYSPMRDTVVMGEAITMHERIQIEQSLKYSKEGCDRLWRSAGVLEADRWMTDDEDYGKWSPSRYLLHKNTASLRIHGVCRLSFRHRFRE